MIIKTASSTLAPVMINVPLVQALITKQNTITDQEFSKTLGIPLETWRSIKKGHRNLGKGSLSAILKAYPDLESAVVNYLKGDK